MKNKDLADQFNQMADLLEFKGVNIFRVNAYRKAARTIDQLTEDIEHIVEQGRLSEVPGIGKGLTEEVLDFLKSGQLSRYDEEKQGIPDTVFDLMKLPSVGPKTAAIFYNDFQVTSVDELETLLNTGKVVGHPGFGEKKVEKIKAGIQTWRQGMSRKPLGHALELVETILKHLQPLGEEYQFFPAGSFRRGKETIGDLDILAAGPDGDKVIQLFNTLPDVSEVIGSGSTKSSIWLDDNFQVDLRVVDSSSLGAALQYFTGSKEHNVKIRELARQKGLKVNEYGVFRGDEKIAGATEEDVYAALGLPWIAPELREDWGEVDAALENKLPKLIELKDIQGDLHSHSNWSDGRYEMEDMAEAARARGYKYLAVTDHSRSLAVAQGLPSEKLSQQIEEIRKLNTRWNDFTLLAGTECDIKSDGTLDYPDELLAQLDFVVASLHVGAKPDIESNTQRVLAAIRNPYVNVIGHPTGRLIGGLLGVRAPFPIDMDAVIAEAVKTGTALEINSSWQRLDLKDIHARAAIQKGAMLCINTDSHRVESLAQVGMGVQVARRAWATPKNVLNTRGLDAIREFRKKKIQLLGG